MASQISHAVRLFVTSLVLAFAAMLTVGASPQSAGGGDPLPALLSEVHALRVAMEQQAAVGPRVQLTLARLNIQEERVSHLASELNAVRQQMSGNDSVLKRLSDELADRERALQSEADPVRRHQFELQQRDLQQQLRLHTAQQEQLRTRENDIAQALATEQARWIELNSRLDELDRLLAPVR
jgi:chromosome segregation ATPase